MPADPIVYCLEKLTDYAAFERLCHELMRHEGYVGIEPLGGFKDKGRDAIHVSRTDPSVTTLFAYSVREDWRRKLDEDADKVKKHNHTCDRFAFLTTSEVTASGRDDAVEVMKRTYGWALELYGLERLRTILAADGRAAVAQHPEIFHPALVSPALPDLPKDATDAVVIDCAAEDEAFSIWLARRLMAEGYRVWCAPLAFTGGESKGSVLQRVMQDHAFRVLSICSPRSAGNPDLAARRGMALLLGRARQRDMVIPLLLDNPSSEALDGPTRELAVVDFSPSWATGLSQLLSALRRAECPRPLSDGAQLALRSAVPNNALVRRAETIYSNCFSVASVPEVIHRFVADRDLDRADVEPLRGQWAFVFLPTRTLLAFQMTGDVGTSFKLRPAGGSCWRHVSEIDGARPLDVVTELLRRSVEQHAFGRGLLRCPQTRLIYFPRNLIPHERLTFQLPDGTSSWLAPTGTRTYWRPGRSSPYRYALAVEFAIRRDLAAEFTLILRMRVRITDPVTDEPVPPRTALSRRKDLCGDWWNDEWLKRTLAVMQFLAAGASEIVIDTAGDPSLRIPSQPVHWVVPIGIAEEALNPNLLDRSDFVNHDDEDQDDEEGDEGEDPVGPSTDE